MYLKELLARAIGVGKQRLRKLMPLRGICAKGKGRCMVSTDSRRHLPIWPKPFNREFNVTQPHKVWVGDISNLANGGRAVPGRRH